MALDELRQRDWKIASKFGEYGDVYEVEGELYGLIGMDLRTYFTLGPNPWASVETIPHYSSNPFEVRRMEKLIEKSGQLEEYVQLLVGAGADLQMATIEQRCQALLEAPYTIPPPPPEPITDQPYSFEIVDAVYERIVISSSTDTIVEAEVAKPAEVEPTRELPYPPDDWWSFYVLGEKIAVTFVDKNGEIEKVDAVYENEANLFSVRQTPLRIDGVSYYDTIEVRWEDGELTPIFERIHEKEGYGTIRVDLKKGSRKRRKNLIGRLDIELPRYDGDILVFTYWGYKYSSLVWELNRSELHWEFADESRLGDDDDY